MGNVSQCVAASLDQHTLQNSLKLVVKFLAEHS